jgi:hypothetical protein
MAKYRYVGVESVVAHLKGFAGRIANAEELKAGESIVEGTLVPAGSRDSDGCFNGTGEVIVEWESNRPEYGAYYATLPVCCFERVVE